MFFDSQIKPHTIASKAVSGRLTVIMWNTGINISKKCMSSTKRVFGARNNCQKIAKEESGLIVLLLTANSM